METINQEAIITAIKKANNKKELTSQDMKYKCNTCKDTTWIIKDGYAVRCDCYKKRLIMNQWQRFGVNPNDIKTLEDYKVFNGATEKAKKKAISYIKNFKSIKTQRENSLCFLGQSGGGKTHLSLVIGKELIEKQKIKVVYMPYFEVMQELKANAMEEEYYKKLQRKYTEAELLIIDELFKDKIKQNRLTGQLTEADMKHIYPIVNQRYNNRLPTIYNSECTPNMLLDLDGALAGRIIESCKNRMIVFKYSTDNNYRLRFI